MRRNVIIILGAVVLAWGALAIALGSPSLKLLAGSAHSSVSPACLPAAVERTATLPGTGVEVSPAPETDTADPHTQISFLGSATAAIRDISVVGARSGPHTGRLRGYSQGDGASFAPDTPFALGESVTVRAALGAGATRIAFRFRVDSPYSTASTAIFPNVQAAPADYQSFYTTPGLQAPVMTVTAPDRDPAAGVILTTNGPGPGQYGPLIYRADGRLVWFDRLTDGETAENLSEQAYEGRRVLTWWKGRVLELGFGQGEDVVMDSRYRTIARIAGGNGLRADLHDFQIAPHGVAYITAYNPIRCDLSSVGGSRAGAIVDTAIEQIDMRTGLVRWEWHSLDHIGAAESEVEAPDDATPWDYFHLNSIDPRAGRQHPHLGTQHLGRISAAARQRQGALAPRRQQELLRDGSGNADGLAARRADAARRRSDVLRRRLEPADPPPISRAANQARSEGPSRAPRGRLHASRPAAARVEPGQHANAPERPHARRLRRRGPGDQ